MSLFISLFKKILIFLFLNSILFGCGKSKLDVNNSDTAQTLSSENASSLVSCKSFRPCKERCDMDGNMYYYDQCDYDTRHRKAYSPACEHLNQCYNKQISQNDYNF